ncbi:MAG: glycosyltransferase family 39 protein, partial [Thermodesulfobacteriota bacterium]
ILAAFYKYKALPKVKTELPSPVSPQKSSPIVTAAMVILCAWALARIAFVLFESTTVPIYSTDAVSTWTSGAKFFFYERGLGLDLGPGEFFGKNYRLFMGHPIFISLLQMWTSLWVGEFSEVCVKISGFAFFISLLAVFFLAVKRETTLNSAVVWVFFLTSAPLIVYHGGDSLSDLPLSYYSLSAVVLLWRFIKNANPRLLMLAGFMLGIGIFVKNEGLLFTFGIAVALILFLKQKKRAILKPFVSFIVPFIIMAAPWFLFKIFNDLGFGHSGQDSGMVWFSDPRFSADAETSIHWEIIPIAVKELFLSANFNLIFSFWAVLTVFKFKSVARTDIKYLYVVTLLVMAVFVFVYLTLEVTAVTESSGFHRNMLTYLPIIFFTSAVLLAREKKKEP